MVDGVCEESESLVYKNIFPFYYIPETQTEAKSYVVLKVDFPRRIDKMYKNVRVYILIFCHQDIMQVQNANGTRIDLMSEVVESLFNTRDDFGFGEMVLSSDCEVNINNTYRGREMIFTVEDFNSDACKND